MTIAEAMETVKKYSERSCNTPSPEEKLTAINDRLPVTEDKKLYDCPVCGNRGGRFIDLDTMTWAQCKCVEYRFFLKQMQRDGLVETIRRCTFDSFETQKQLQQTMKRLALEFVNDHSGRCFFVGGQSGSGKTHICTATLCKMAQAQGRLFGKRARYMRWLDIIRKYNADGADRDAIIESIRECDALYLDDFLKVQQGQIKNITPAASNLAFSIVDIFEKKPSAVLIISSELTEPELQAVDTAVHGRICALATKKYCINVSKNKESNYRLKQQALFVV